MRNAQRLKTAILDYVIFPALEHTIVSISIFLKIWYCVYNAVSEGVAAKGSETILKFAIAVSEIKHAHQ